jgi:hypothetical protein
MKTFKYILILAVLTSSVTAYGSTKISIGFSFQPARQPVYIYRPVPVYQQPVVYYTCPQPVYVTPAPVYYAQPEWSLGFSWGGGNSFNGGYRSYNDGHHNYNGGHQSNHDGGRDGWRAHR